LLLQQALSAAEPKVIDLKDVEEPNPFPKDRGSRPKLSA
jgi:hypothetical protein